MKTKYESLEYKVDTLISAATRCFRQEKMEMAIMWEKKATELKSMILNMSVNEAIMEV